MPPTERDVETREIEALVAQWASATQEKNLASLLELMTDDITFLPAAGSVIRGRSAARVVYEHMFAQVTRMESRPVVEEIQIAGDWAFLTGIDELLLTMAATGERVHMKGRAISILRRQKDGSWKFARGINNMVRQEPARRE